MLNQPLNEESAPVVAIDLGSNSFHLLVARRGDNGLLKPITAQAHKVQLGLGMVDGCLSESAIARGLECLDQFAGIIQGSQAAQVRVVGTQALREATNQAAFIDPASKKLGHTIEVISGEVEAALAYCGVVSQLNVTSVDSMVPRLIVDIGGGSTELVVGRGHQVLRSCSVAVGCVAGLQFFPGGVITSDHIDTAQQAAFEQFAAAALALRLGGEWQLAIGCSGTLLAVEQVLIQQGWVEQGINLAGLQKLRQALLQFDCIEAVSFQGLCEARRSIFATGVAIVLALFEAFELDSMQLSNAGLREGVAWQLLHSNA